MMESQFYWKIFGLTLCLVLTMCSEVIVKTQLIKFDVDKKANQDHPIAVELLTVYDEELLQQVSKLTAGEWFEKRKQFQRDYPTALGWQAWEIVPGQVIRPFMMPARSQAAKGILLFAHYHVPGDHRLRLDAYPAVKIHFLEEEMVAQPLIGG